jgi:hypothetical protein
VIALTVAAFPGVSIEHNVDERLGAVAGRDWQWRKGRDVELESTRQVPLFQEIHYFLKNRKRWLDTQPPTCFDLALT